MELRLYIANLGKYNEGILEGDWIELPFEEDNFQELLDSIGINDRYEEYAIHDYESNLGYLEIGEYDNIQSLNELAKRIESLNVNISVLDIITSNFTGDLEEAIEIIESGDYTVLDNIDNEADLGYALVEMYGVLDGLPDYISNYFDYDSYGRDAVINGMVIDKGMAIEIYY